MVVKAEIRATELAHLSSDHPAFRAPALHARHVLLTGRGRRSRALAADIAAFAALSPFMIEAKPQCIADLEAGMEAARAMKTRIWLNTLDVAHMTDFNDSSAMADADAIWGRLLDLVVGAIQTDESAALLRYLASRGLRSARP